jgi:drug/metabolite transporter (DMT)-like permease
MLALVWGYNWVPMKLGIPYSGALVFAALRTFLGSVVLFALLPVLGRPLRPRALGWTLLLGLLQTGAFTGLVMWALERGGAGTTAVLSNTMPFWLLLMAWVGLGEKLRGAQWLSVGLALCGLVLIISPWRLHGAFSALLAVASAIFWAASAVVAKLLRRRHDVDLLSLTAWQMLLGSLPLVLIAGITSTKAPIWSGTLIWTVAYNVIFATALGWFLWLYVLHALPTGVAGIGNLGTPVIGVLASWLQLGERPSVNETMGIVLVISALGVLVLRGIVPRSRPAAVAAVPAVAEPPVGDNQRRRPGG